MQPHYSSGTIKITASLARRRAHNDKMTRTIIYILPRQYARYQYMATKMQRHFAELVRASLSELLARKDLRRYLRDPDVQALLERTENTMSVQIYLPVAIKQRIERLQKNTGITQSGLFRVALNIPF